ncbi:uncharacterized protein VTP21DRAFT_3298 [Calcarisporiella thermophila]|uniref:uncharacterized protein n=1 Tax=Calcarisporiella thermophila TaxID=911321 RepID=UPI003743B9A9
MGGEKRKITSIKRRKKDEGEDEGINVETSSTSRKKNPKKRYKVTSRFRLPNRSNGQDHNDVLGVEQRTSGNSNVHSQELGEEHLSELEQEEEAEYVEFGHLLTRIVGIRYYTGIINVGEMTVFKREPHNPYDENAIRVDNMSQLQVGHIPRDKAAILAPLLDAKRLVMEGIVSGRARTYDIPLLLTFYASPHDIPNVKRVLAMQGIDVGLPKPTIKMGRQSLPVKMDESWGELMAATQKLDQKRSQQLLDKIGISVKDLAKLQKASQPENLRTKLLPFQLQGLQWLLDHEHPQLPEGKKIEQFWKVQSSTAGSSSKTSEPIYNNILTNHSMKTRPNLMRGGILSDSMGLGKTLQIIALIVSDPTGKNLVQNPVASDPSYSKTTLVVVPLSVIGNWVTQFASHVSPEYEFKGYVYHGPDRNDDPKFLMQHDYVITTYSTLSQDDIPKGKGKAKVRGLFGVKWRRVVLDEGHLIKNHSTKTAQACTALSAERRIILTGTPIQNSLNDLYSMLKFLHFSPLDDRDFWRSCIWRPMKIGNLEGLSRLKALLQFINLRRTKEMEFNGKPILHLPPCESFLYKVKFPPSLQKKYTRLEKEAKTLLRDCIQSGGQNSVLSNYMVFLSLLTRLRQLCDHEALMPDEITEMLESAAATTNIDKEVLKQLIEALQMAIDSNDDCCICLETISEPVVTPCRHVFDLKCIEKVLEVNPSCPMCRGKVELKELITMPEGKEMDAELTSREEKGKRVLSLSPKIEALLKFLKNSHTQDTTTKSVVFSQWTSFLDLVEPHLEEAGLQYVRLDGKMPSVKREAAIDAFQTDPNVTVFLMSLKCGSLGLNLTAANQVFLLDPWWNPAVEDQATDRIYRLGQTRPVRIFRLVIENTVEDRVIERQNIKRKLAAQALGDTQKGNVERGCEQRMDDLMALLLADESPGASSAGNSGK